MGFRDDPNPLRVPPPQKLIPASGNISLPPRLRDRRSQQAQERRQTVGDTLLGDATGPLVGVGIFMGRDGEDIEFRVGDPGGDFMHWTGSALNITGVLTATSGVIGGWTISANALTSGSVILNATNEQLLFGAASAPLVGVGIFLGLDGADYEFRAGDPAGAFLHWDATNLALTGAVITSPGTGSSASLLGWAQDMLWSATDNDTVAWGSGTITLSNGTTFSIVGGNTGNITVPTYIFLDAAVSTTVLQTTSTASDAVGPNRILVAVAEDVADSAKDAEFVIYGGSGGVGVSKTILAGVIAANSISANEIAANTITASEISSLNLSTQSLTATVGFIGGWTLGANTLSSGSVSINSSTEQILMGASAILTGTGVFLGKDTTYKFRIGDPAGNYMLWNGVDTIAVAGDMRWIAGGSASFYDSAAALKGSITADNATSSILAVGTWNFTTASISVTPTKKVIFDGGGDEHTHIAEATANRLDFTAGGTKVFDISPGIISMVSGQIFLPGGVASTYYDGTGGVKHSFVISNTERFLIEASGITVTGGVTQTFSATGNDVHAFVMDVSAGGFGDVKAFNINYATGSLSATEEESVILIGVDESASSGGDIVALEVLATQEGSAMVYAIEAGANVAPVKHQSGVFVDMDSALVNATDRLAEFISTGSNIQMFVANGDTVTIGDAAKFEELEFILAVTASNPGIRPVFEYSDGAAGWIAFSPIDATNGMRNNGVIAWDDADLSGWAQESGEYLIRITRGTAAGITQPTESIVQISAVVQYSWDKDGDVSIRNLAAGGTLAVTGASALTGPVSITKLDSESILNVIVYSTNNNRSNSISLQKSAQNTAGFTATGTNDILGSLIWQGTRSGASAFGTGATIRVTQTGAAGATYVPAEMIFEVSDGAGAPTSALTLASDLRATFGGDLTVSATKKIYFDDGGDTYIHEVSANKVAIVVGSSTEFDLNTTQGKFYSDLTIVGECEIDGALNHDGTTAGFFGTAPVSQPSIDLVDVETIGQALLDLGLAVEA